MAVEDTPGLRLAEQHRQPAELHHHRCALTSKVDENLYPSEVLIRAPEGGLTVDSVLLLNQIRSIDRRRLMRLLRAVRLVTTRQVDQALRISLGLVEL